MVIQVRDLREYLEWLDSRNKLLKVEEPLSPILEIPTFLRQIMYMGGPTVLFEKVTGFEGWRVVGNIFSNLDTFRMVLGVKKFEDIGQRLVNLGTQSIPTSLVEKLRSLGELKRLANFLPKKTGKAYFKKNIVESDEAPLNIIPAFKTWPKDGNRYLTYPLVITRDPVKGVYNMGVYRIMILDGERGVVHWQIHKRGAKAYFDYREIGDKEIPVAVAIGSDPGTLLTGASPVPYPIDKFLFAGIIRGKGLEVFELRNGILVPANAEIVLEGFIKIDELENEGPFGDHFGFYDKPVEKYPVLHVERMYFRENPIYYGSVVGKPVLEDAVIGKAVERIFLPIIKVLLPEVVDINFPPHGVFQGIMIVSIKKRYPGQAKKVMMALWGLGQTSLTKIIIVVDHTINPHDINQVIWAISSYVNPQRDVLIIPFTHADALDPANISPSYGSKLGIDATKKLPEENFGKDWPEEVEEDPIVLEKIRKIINKLFGERHENKTMGSRKS